MNKNKMKVSTSRKVFLVFDYCLMILLALICIYPFWYVLCYSLSDTTAASVNTPVLLPSGFTLSNYKEILTLKGFFVKNCGWNYNIRILLLFSGIPFY